MKSLFLIILLLISSAKNFSQNTQKDSTCISNEVFDLIIKDVQNCDSLKLRYAGQLREIKNFTDKNLKLINKNNEIISENIKTNLKLENLQAELTKRKTKKGISVIECILISAGTFSLGVLFF